MSEEAEPRKWILCRWREGRTAAALASRGTPSSGHQDPVTGASFCGPLSYGTDLHHREDLPAHLRGMGFPGGEIGKVELFDSPEAAAEHATWDGVDKSSIDLPAPLDCFHFGVEHYRYWDGKTEVVYDGGDLRQARAERALRLDDLGEAAIRNKVKLTCRPLWDKLRPWCPTADQVAELNAADARHDAQLRGTPVSGETDWTGNPLPDDGTIA